MEALTGTQHIAHPVLHVFQGELMRIKQYVIEQRNVRKDVSNYGKLYGLYTHSKSAVVHVATLNSPTLTQLELTVYRRLEHAPNKYNLSCVGEWLTIQNVDIPVLKILRKKAAGLSEGETCFCIVVDDESRLRYDFKNVENNVQALFLLKDTICRIDMKILQWESPFHLDVEFIEQIYENDRVVIMANGPTSKNHKGFPGTDMKAMPKNPKPKVAQTGADVNKSSAVEIESENKGNEDTWDSQVEIKGENVFWKAKVASLTNADASIDATLRGIEEKSDNLSEEVVSSNFPHNDVNHKLPESKIGNCARGDEKGGDGDRVTIRMGSTKRERYSQ